jgi:hypothetical protein
MKMYEKAKIYILFHIMYDIIIHLFLDDCMIKERKIIREGENMKEKIAGIKFSELFEETEEYATADTTSQDLDYYKDSFLEDLDEDDPEAAGIIRGYIDWH